MTIEDPDIFVSTKGIIFVSNKGLRSFHGGQKFWPRGVQHKFSHPRTQASEIKGKSPDSIG